MPTPQDIVANVEAAKEDPPSATTIDMTATTVLPSSTSPATALPPATGITTATDATGNTQETENPLEVMTPTGTAILAEAEPSNASVKDTLRFSSMADADADADAGVTTSAATLITTTQPTPTLDPELGLKGLGMDRAGYPGNQTAATAPVARRKRRNRLRMFRPVLSTIGSVLVKALSLLWIGLLYGIPGAIIVALGIAVFVGIPLAFGAAYGSVGMLIGNGILRAAHMAHYTNNASAAAIGATGAAISVPCLGFVLNLCGIRSDEENPSPWYIRMPITVVAHTMSGAIGCAALLKHHVDLGPIDVLHATRAGALGGAALGPGTLVLMPAVGLVLGIVLSPLWIAMMMGLRWCHVRSRETYDGNWHRYSYCVSYGTCGDDEEIEEEIAMARTPKFQFSSGRGHFITEF